jgi:hypothetical protein
VHIHFNAPPRALQHADDNAAEPERHSVPPKATFPLLSSPDAASPPRSPSLPLQSMAKLVAFDDTLADIVAEVESLRHLLPAPAPHPVEPLADLRPVSRPSVGPWALQRDDASRGGADGNASDTAAGGTTAGRRRGGVAVQTRVQHSLPHSHGDANDRHACGQQEINAQFRVRQSNQGSKSSGALSEVRRRAGGPFPDAPQRLQAGNVLAPCGNADTGPGRGHSAAGRARCSLPDVEQRFKAATAKGFADMPDGRQQGLDMRAIAAEEEDELLRMLNDSL